MYKYLFPFCFLALLLLGSACNKKCEDAYVGQLCFDNKTDSFKVDIYVNGKKYYTLAPREKRCEKDFPAGALNYGLIYIPLNHGQGLRVSSSAAVRACEKTIIEVR